MRLFILLAALACAATGYFGSIELTPYFDEPVTFVECGDVPADATPFAKSHDPSCTLSSVELSEHDVTSTPGQTPPSGFPADKFVKSHIRTWTASDSCGNTASVSRTFHIYDTTAPTISGVPDDTTEECDEIARACVAVAHDDCDEDVTVQMTETNTKTTECNQYTITRTFVATDNSGNTATARQVVTVTDSEPPVIFSLTGAALVQSCAADSDCPTGQTCSSDSECTLTLDCHEFGRFDETPAIAVDNCNSNVAVEYTQQEDDQYDNDPCSFGYTRTYTATDKCMQQHSVIQRVVYTDNTPPVLSQPNTILPVSCDNVPEPCPPSVFDACDNAINHDTVVEVTKSTKDADNHCANKVIYAYQATDKCGNPSAVVEQTIEVLDQVAPVFTYLPPVVTDPLECEEPNLPEPSATDNCGCVTVSTLKTTTGKATTADDFANYEVVYTYTATDQCGLSTVVSRTVSVRDSVDPVLTVGEVDGSASCEVPAVPDIQASDACCFDKWEPETISEETCPQPGTLYTKHTRVTAYDCVGRTTSKSYTLTMPDTNTDGVYTITNLPESELVVQEYSTAAVESALAKYRYSDNNFAVTVGCLSFDININHEKVLADDTNCDHDFTLVFTYTLTLTSNSIDGVAISGDCYQAVPQERRISFKDTTAPSCDEEDNVSIPCSDFCSFDAPTEKECGEYTGSISSSTNCDDYDGCGDCTMTLSYQVDDECGNSAEHSYDVTFSGPASVDPSWVRDSNGNIVGASHPCADVVYTEEINDDSTCSCGAQTTYTATTPCGGYITYTETVTPDGGFCDGGDPVPTAQCKITNGWHQVSGAGEPLVCQKSIGVCLDAEAAVFEYALPEDHTEAVVFSDQRCSCTAVVDATDQLDVQAAARSSKHETTCSAYMTRKVTATDCSSGHVTATLKVVADPAITVAIIPRDYTPACGEKCPQVKGDVEIKNANNGLCAFNSKYGLPDNVDGVLQKNDDDCAVNVDGFATASFHFAVASTCGSDATSKDYPFKLNFIVGVSVDDDEYTCDLPDTLPEPTWDEGNCVFGEGSSEACASFKKCTDVSKVDSSSVANGPCTSVHSTTFAISNKFGSSATDTRKLTVSSHSNDATFVWNSYSGSTIPGSQTLCVAPDSIGVTGTMCGQTYTASVGADTLTGTKCSEVQDGTTYRQKEYQRVYTVQNECIDASITQDIVVLHPHPTVSFQNILQPQYDCTATVPSTDAVYTDTCGEFCTTFLTSESTPECDDNGTGESRVTHSIRHTVELAAEGTCPAVVATASHSYDVVTSPSDVTINSYNFDVTEHPDGSAGTVDYTITPGCAIDVVTDCSFLDDGEHSDYDCCSYPRAECTVDVCGVLRYSSSVHNFDLDCDQADVNPAQPTPTTETCLVNNGAGYTAPVVDNFSKTTTSVAQPNCDVVYTTVYTPSQGDDLCYDYEGQTTTHTITHVPVDISTTDKTVECSESWEWPAATQPTSVCKPYTIFSDAVYADCPDDNTQCVEVQTKTYSASDGCVDSAETVTSTVTIQDTTAPEWITYPAVGARDYAHVGACPIGSDQTSSATEWSLYVEPQGRDNCDAQHEYEYEEEFGTCHCKFTRTSSLKDGVQNNAVDIVETITYNVCDENSFYVNGDKVNSLPDLYVYHSGGDCSEAVANDIADVTAKYACTEMNGDLTVNTNNNCVSGFSECTYTWEIADDQCTTGSIEQKVYCSALDVTPLDKLCDDEEGLGDKDTLLLDTTGQGFEDYVHQELAGEANQDDTLTTTVTYRPQSATVTATTCEHGFTVEYTYDWQEDGGASEGEVTLTVLVRDNEDPTWVTPVTLHSGTISDCTWTENKPEAEDNCDDCVEVFETFTEAPTGEGCHAKYTKSYVGYDDCGGSTSTLHETWYAGDRTEPTIEFKDGNGDAFQPAEYTCASDRIQAEAVATDNCDGLLTTPSPVENEQCWSTTYTYTVSDDCGNTATESYTLPRKTAAHGAVYLQWNDWNSDIEVPCFTDGSTECQLDAYVPHVTYLCDDGATVAVTGGDLVEETATPSCAHRYSRTYTATHGSCFLETKTQYLCIEDTPVPEYSCEDVLGGSDGVGSNTYTIVIDGATAESCDTSDIPYPVDSCCSLLHQVVISSDDVSDSCGVGTSGTIRKTVTKTFQITHLGGGDNGALCTLKYEIVDNTGPVIVANDQEQECILPAAPTGSATDTFCGVSTTVTVTKTAIGTSPFIVEVDNTESEKVYEYSAQDTCGTNSNELVTLTVFDRENPTIDLTPGADGCKSYQAPEVCASDNCPDVTLDQVRTTTELAKHSATCPNFEVVYTWVATDKINGKTATESATYLVEDTTPPTFEATNEWDVVLDCGDDVPAPPTAIDSCHEATVDLKDEDVQTCVTLPDGSSASKVTTQVWEATDACGNFVQKTRTITVRNPAPVITKPRAVFSNKDCRDTLQPTDFTADVTDDVCTTPDGGLTVNVQVDQVDGTCSDTYTVTYKATDSCGIETVETSGTLSLPYPPADEMVTWTLPTTLSYECTEDPAAQLSTEVSAEVALCNGQTDDSDSAFSIDVSEGADPTTQVCNVGKILSTQPFQYNFNHQCAGSVISVPQTVSFTDITPPTFDLPHSNVNEDCKKDVADWARPGSSQPIPGSPASDTCDLDVEVCYTSSLVETCEDGFQRIVEYTATDDACNSVSYSFTVTVDDTTAPYFEGSLPETETVDCSYTPVNLIGLDDCTSERRTVSPESASLTIDADQGELSKTEYTYTITDACGQSTQHVHTITVVDIEDPVLNGDFTDVDENCDREVPYPEVSVSDNCGCASYLMTETTEIMGCVTKITRTFVATDSNGRTTTATQNIKFHDRQHPTITIDSHGTGLYECDATPYPQVSVSDNCIDAADLPEAEITVTNLVDSNGEGEIVYQIVARDVCGNPSLIPVTHTFVDTTPPSINVPDDSALGCSDDIPTFDEWKDQITASDACSTPDIEISQIVNPGDCDCRYTITYTATATDKAAIPNMSDDSWTVTVTPDRQCKDELFQFSGWAAGVESGGDFDEDPGRADVSYADPYGDAGDLLAVHQTAAPVSELSSNACTYKIKYTFAVEDECGKECLYDFTIQIRDVTAPELYPVPEQNLEVECDAIPVPCEVKAYDDCDETELDVTYTEMIYNQASDSEGDGKAVHCKNEGGARAGICYTIVRTWEATDSSSNPVKYEQTIKVRDQSAPSFSPAFDADDREKTVECECDELGIPVEINAIDNCDNWVDLCKGDASSCGSDGDALFSDNPLAFNAADGETKKYVRTYYAADTSGNVNEFKQTITVVDTQAPVIFIDGQQATTSTESVSLSCPHELIEFNRRSYAAFDECDATPGVTTTGRLVELTDPNNCVDTAPFQVVTTALDASGQNSTHTTAVTYRDRTAPEARRLSVPVQCNAESLRFGAIKALAGITDNCRAAVSIAFKSSDCASGTATGIEFTNLNGDGATCAAEFTVTDTCGNDNDVTLTFRRQCV